MKILVIQLLRLGDIIMSAPAIKAIKELYPNSEIHLLMNSQFRSVKPLLPGIDQFIGFDRDKIQRKLKHRNVNYYSAYEGMKKLTDHLKIQSYDLVVNLTHNRLSGYIVGMLHPAKHIGLKLTKDKSSEINTSGFQFLNTHAVEGEFTNPHFVDIGLNAFAFKGKRQISLTETTAGFEESKAILKQKKLDLLLQPYSSEEKKNWGDRNLKEFLKLYFKKNLKHNVGILCAPFEAERLRNLVQDIKNDNFYICVADLETAFSIIKKSKILVTTDTSIKHLASATNTRIIELSMETCNFGFTGAYKKNSYIFRVNRYDLNADLLLRFVSAVQTRNHIQMKNLNSQSIYEVYVKENMGFFPVPINLNNENLFEMILRLKNQLYINQSNREKIYNEFYELISETILLNKSSMQVLVDLYKEVTEKTQGLMNVSGAFAQLNFLKQDSYILNKIVQFYLRENNLSNIEELFSPQSVFSFSGIVREELDFIEFILIKLMDQRGDLEWRKNKHLKNLLPL